MPSESKSAVPLQTQTEKPSHYRYLKEFRVEQCQLFPQHKCTQHRPFTCFNWHFPNQKRRRPIRKKDGTFNYSPDTYCTKYDETSGTCPDGDECPFLHRTAGDTERRYHLRYFKTCMCVYETDSRGFCTKNGAHCAFAHGEIDKRPPVYDITELQQQMQQQTEECSISNGPNPLDKERNMMIDDPKWQDANYVLIHYKTEPCKRPPRLCRQGYACPQYHNQRDRRRSPKKFKYRSTPCPQVKNGDEWGEPAQCESGDNCSYCHTRTEQQFHPEIYKSSKCHDVVTSQYCPRGPFCAFAHADHEMNINRNVPSDTNLQDIIQTVLPNTGGNPSVASLSGLSGIEEMGAIGSSGSIMKPGENGTTILNHNSSGSSFNVSNNNNNSINDNGVEHILSGINLASTSNSTTSVGQLSASGDRFSDVLRNTNSALEPHGGTYNPFGNSANTNPINSQTGPSFGTQSFASAAAAGSVNTNAAGPVGSTTSLNHGGKFFDESSRIMKVEESPFSMDINNMISGSLGSGKTGNGPFAFDNILGLGYQSEERDEYKLFGGAKQKGDSSRDDSPSTIDKDIEQEHYSSSDFSMKRASKPVSIPVNMSASGDVARDRYSSNSSPMTNPVNHSASSSLSMGQASNSLFQKHDLEQAADILSSHMSFMDYSSASGAHHTSKLPSGRSSNGFMHNQGLINNLSNPTPVSGMGPIGPVGSIGSVTSPNSNAMNTNILNLSMLNRKDLQYLSVATLSFYINQCKIQLETLKKALNSHSKDSPHYCCLNCRVKERPRTIALLPCDHQVVCSVCAATIRVCPLCKIQVVDRKQMGLPDQL